MEQVVNGTRLAAASVHPWTDATLSQADWRFSIPVPVQSEIAAVVTALRYQPRPVGALDPDAFALVATRRLMASVKGALDTGAGFAVLDRFPVDKYSKDELKAIYWLLSRMLGPIVPQGPDGTLMHDVRDTGRKMSERVRGDLTNQELNWHTDNGFSTPPKYFGLAVLRTAKQGGESKAVNLIAAHDTLRDRAPALLDRLYEPFIWRRIGDYGEGDDSTASFPVYGHEGAELVCRLNRRVIEAGQLAANVPLDPVGREAIDRLYDVLDEPGFAFEYRLEPGQMQWMNNHALAHHRTSFVDWDEPDRKRHLVRIYIDGGSTGHG